MRTEFIKYFVVFLIMAACGGKSDSISNEEIISGDGEKTWKATRETNAQGEKDKLSRQEKKESITFSSNGNVKMTNNQEMMGGTWSFMNNTLSLQFTGTNVTEEFRVLELEKDKIRLAAADGSELTLEPE